MERKKLDIWLLEDTPSDAELVIRLLKQQQYESCFKVMMTRAEFEESLTLDVPDLILSDNAMPSFSASEALQILRERRIDIPFILVTGTVSEEFAAAIIKKGADDYVLKDRLTRLPIAIDAALAQRKNEKDKREALERLKESEEMHRNIMERVSDGFMALDTDWRYTYVNKTAGEILQCDPEQTVGRYILDVFPLAAGMKFLEAFREAMRSQYYIYLEEYSPVLATWIENNIYPSEKGISVFFRDISSRKNAEAKLKASEEKYRNLVEQAPDAIVISAADGRIITVNRSAAQMSQYSQEELLKMNVFDFILPGTQATSPLRCSPLTHGETITTERKMKTKDGSICYLEITCTVVSDGNLLSVVRNVSERVKAQNEIKETTEKLRSLSVHLTNIREEERKRIGREIHDELGQLLTAMKMDAVWVEKNLSSENEPGLLKSKLGNIINMLDQSNISIRRIINELRPAIFDNYGLIDALKQQNDSFTLTTGIPVHFDVPEAIPKFPEDITICIFRVYQEALTNISRYSKAKNVTSSLVTGRHEAGLTVEDDGTGFDTLELNTAERFGLLGITERVRSLKGKFKLVTAPGEGTKIMITIPLPEENNIRNL